MELLGSPLDQSFLQTLITLELQRDVTNSEFSFQFRFNLFSQPIALTDEHILNIHMGFQMDIILSYHPQVNMMNILHAR